MRGIIQKELAQYFKSMTGYVFVAVFLAITGFCFVMVNLVGRSGDIKDFFSSISSVLLFLLPMLTMRLFTEERRQRTDELLLTAPVSITAVIAGKYAATLLVLLLATAVTLIYPVILAVLGSAAVMDTIANYLGFILICGAFLSIGLFVSVVAENQLVSAIITYAVLLMLYAVDSLDALVPGHAAAAVQIFLSLRGHYEAFTYGIVDAANIVYFISITVLFLFLSVYSLEQKRLD